MKKCIFCKILNEIINDPNKIQSNCIIYQSEKITGLIPLHYRGNTMGNVIIISNNHYENIFDVDFEIGNELLMAISKISNAIKENLSCDGITIKQNNEPAGDQDVRHFHVHIYPRYNNDNLFMSKLKTYNLKERQEYAEKIKKGLL